MRLLWYNQTDMNGKERRKDKRYPAVYPLQLKEEDLLKALGMINVSKSGIAFISSRPVNKNDEFCLEIFLKKRMFNLRMTVIHSMLRKDGFYSVGAKFLDTPEGFKENFEKEINEIMRVNREHSRYQKKKLSFEEASREYLKNIL